MPIYIMYTTQCHTHAHTLFYGVKPEGGKK